MVECQMFIDTTKLFQLEHVWGPNRTSGFNPAYKGKKASDLTAIYTINFSGNKVMYKDFSDFWSDDKRWEFDYDIWTATFTF